jgi:hypothetical protein
MISFSELILKKNNYKHHALLLISKQFEHSEITSKEFRSFAQEFCGIKLHDDEKTSSFEMAQYHPDIFIADRQKKTLTISDLEKIKELSLYPPVEGYKRLFVIESCHRMNMHAANALLKILEEPSSSALFLMTCPHISSVLPTIASRTQKIVIAFHDSKKTDINSLFSENDFNWIKEQIVKFNLTSYRSFVSLSETKPKSILPSYLKEVIEYSERLSKEYKSNDLCDLIVTLISARLKENPEFLQTAKIVLSTISQWKEAMPFNPSTQFWLTRIFLSFN